jgi:hypothetical protein
MVACKSPRNHPDLLKPILISSDGIGHWPVSNDSRDRRIEVVVHALAISCAAGENTRLRMSSVTTSPAMPDAARIMATMTN